MMFSTLTKCVAVTLVSVSAVGCSTWDSMTSRQKGAVSGAGLGGVAGAAITGGQRAGDGWRCRDWRRDRGSDREASVVMSGGGWLCWPCSFNAIPQGSGHAR